MEEKERYEVKIYAGCEYYSITDTKEKQQITIENTINLLNQQDKRIKELEEENRELHIAINLNIPNQLAEKDKIEYTDTINFVETGEPDIVAKELDRLNEQLAEKEKEIEKLNACVDFYKSYYISFNEKVINELEKVKEFVSRQLFITTKDCNDLDEAEAKGCNELREETIKEIDNQIKNLKEKNNEKGQFTR